MKTLKAQKCTEVPYLSRCNQLHSINAIKYSFYTSLAGPLIYLGKWQLVSKLVMLQQL